MQHIQKTIILLSAIFCMSYSAENRYSVTATGNFSAPNKSINTLWKDMQVGYGIRFNKPIIGISNTTISHEIVYHKLSFQAVTQEKIFKTNRVDPKILKTKRVNPMSEIDTSMILIEPLPEEVPLPEEAPLPEELQEKIETKTAHLVGYILKAHYTSFYKDMKCFIGVMPFTGVLREYKKSSSNSELTTLTSPAFLIEAGLQGPLYKNLDWIFISKYIKSRKSPALWSVELGANFNI